LERKQQPAKKNKKENVEEIATDTAFEPLSIIKLLCKLRTDKSLMEGRQEDAEEFLSFLLNHLSDEMIEVRY
jgi:ubiquitin carboxyl-terminal hydrolase 10